MTAKGAFYTDKIDLLVSYLIMDPLSQLWEKYVPEKIKVRSPAAAGGQARAPSPAACGGRLQQELQPATELAASARSTRGRPQHGLQGARALPGAPPA